MQIYGDYQLAGSTLTLDYSTYTYHASATAPLDMSGRPNSTSILSTNDSNAVSQLITITNTSGTTWTRCGVRRQETWAASPGRSPLQNIPTSGPVQCVINFTQSGSHAVGDVVNFGLIAVSNDAGQQKKLQFGPAAGAYNHGRSKIEIAAGAGFHAVGQSATANPTLIDMMPGGGTYYTFVDSGAFTIQYASMTNMDESGVQIWYSSGVFSVNNSTFGPTPATAWCLRPPCSR